MDVKAIYLLRPYEEDFRTPLPAWKDLIVISVSKDPPSDREVPSFVNDVAGTNHYSRVASVVGRTRDGCVSNHRSGTVNISTNVDGTGTITFVLENGKPGDSGTVLHVSNRDGRFLPVGVFRGVLPKPNPLSHPRGQGAIIPPMSALTKLDVLNLNATPQEGHVRCEI